MTDPVFSKDIRPVSELKAYGSEIVSQVVQSHRPVFVTRRGRGVAVLVELEDYEHMREEIAFGRALDAGALQAEQGEFASAEEVERTMARLR